MITELKWMELASGQRKVQVHEQALFPCSAYYTDWRRGRVEGVPWHWHDELEFMLVDEGAAQVEFGDRAETLGAGDGYFCNSRTLHRIAMTACERCRVNSFVVDARLLSGGDGSVFDSKYLRPITSRPSFPGLALHSADPGQRAVLQHVREAYRACREEPFGFEYAVRYHLGMATALIPGLCGDALAERPGRVDEDRERIQRMLNHIHQNYAGPLTVSEMAAAAGVCAREAQRCFRRVLRQTPAEYIRQYRLQMARRLLMEGERSILEIGMACGFENPSHFSRVFRECTGQTPGEYRRGTGRQA